MKDIKVKDRGEDVALFRSEIVGALTRRELARGALRSAFVELSKERFRRPGATCTSSFSVTTLERWYYQYKLGGLDALRPKRRCDTGRCRKLLPEQRQLLLDIRREHPSATVPLILRTLILDGRVDDGAISASAVQRLYRQEGLDRIPMREPASPMTRLRWEADRPGALWHGDVCHAEPILVGKEKKPVRIHGFLDDASRFVVAMEAHHQEREEDMLGILVGAIRRHGRPDAIYLDNGATYRGDILRVTCGRLGISLLHAKPYDPQARGKMERFWRTLRQGCVDFIGEVSSLHDVNVRLLAFLDTHYHKAPHASLFGKSPEGVYQTAERAPDDVDEAKLREALTVRVTRRVRRDSTVPIDGVDWEVDHGYLAGHKVVAARCLVDPREPPWIEHEGKMLKLHIADPKKNALMKRPPRRPLSMLLTPTEAPPEFDPNRAAMDKFFGRKPKRSDDDAGAK